MDNGPSIHDRTTVYGIPGHGLVGIVTRDPATGEHVSIRIPRERIMQLCLDLLEMADGI